MLLLWCILIVPVSVLQRFTEVGDSEAEPGPPSRLAARGRAGDCQPPQAGVT